MQTVLITGNTYPVKDALRGLGGKWDPVQRGWQIPAEKEQQARSLVSAAPPSKPRRFGGYRRSAMGNYAPGGKRCPMCGQRDCEGAWGGLCCED